VVSDDKVEKNHKNVTENGNFYEKPAFDQIDFFIVVTQKLITINRYLNFSPNVYISVIYTRLNFQIGFFELLFR